MIDTWDGECVLLGDFNEMHSIKERHGTVFKANGANAFNNFITMTGLVDLPLEGYPLTWSHKFASKMSKLDRLFLESQFPNVLTSDQLADLERDVTHEEIKKAVWDCGINKSPNPDYL
ncbi:RNA-directed DNA polymerase, eukaryota [Tanacetum coccineum]